MRWASAIWSGVIWLVATLIRGQSILKRPSDCRNRECHNDGKRQKPASENCFHRLSLASVTSITAAGRMRVEAWHFALVPNPVLEAMEMKSGGGPNQTPQSPLNITEDVASSRDTVILPK